MMQQTIKITNVKGLHARPSAKLSKLANSFPCQVLLSLDERKIDAKSIIEIMTLGAGYGSSISVETRGFREEEALQAIIALINNKFEEE